MQYQLNGKDLKEVFGVAVQDGAATLLQFPKRKESINTNWPEQDGIDIDLADPHFEAREFTLNCWLVANSRDDFKTKFFGLFTELKKQYTQTLYSVDLDMTYYIYFKEMQGMKKLSAINANQVGVQFDLLFGEANPNANIPNVYLADENNHYIII